MDDNIDNDQETTVISSSNSNNNDDSSNNDSILLINNNTGNNSNDSNDSNNSNDSINSNNSNDSNDSNDNNSDNNNKLNLLSLPLYILDIIINQYLNSLNTLAYIDTAYCNHYYRRHLIDIFNNDDFVIDTITLKDIKYNINDMMTWIGYHYHHH